MGSVRAKAPPVGSTEWIFDENTQLAHFGAQEIEDFTFAARNEVEWLNEHMRDIFTKSQVDVTEIFKTPGKLRGKTPRTARKRNALETRQPLTDVFSTNARQAPRTSPTHRLEEEPIKDYSTSVPVAPPAPLKPAKINTDSGYHGLSEDETDPEEYLDAAKAVMKDKPNGQNADPLAVPRLIQGQLTSPSTERATTTEGSFHSAREGPNESEVMVTLSEPAFDINEPQEEHRSSNAPPQSLSPERAESVKEDAMDIDQRDDDLALDEPIDESNSPSQGSSPFEPIVRKSSLTFASLPAPEPWTNKKSMGARTSRTSHLDQNKNALSRGSYMGRFAGGKSLGTSKQPDEKPNMEHETDLDETPQATIVDKESDGETKLTQLHNKSSTQRLHDKISMLGKTQTARPTKSIPTNAAPSNPLYPELPPTESQTCLPEQIQPPASKPFAATAPEDDDDDWIQPPPNQLPSAKRPQLPKSTTADVMEHIRGKQHIGDDEFGPGSYDNAVFQNVPASKQHMLEKTALSPNLARSASAAALGPPQRNAAESENPESTSNQAANPPSHPSSTAIPVDTPVVKRNADGPISASKSRLQSIMKTARGLFTSSAGVSAQAKIEALSSPSTRFREKIQEALSSNSEPHENVQAISQSEGRKTRSSTEKEEKRKLQAAAMHEHKYSEGAAAQPQSPQMSELARLAKDAPPGEHDLKTAQSAKSIRHSPRRLHKQSEVRELINEGETRASNIRGHTMGPPQAQQSQLQKPKDLRRPVRPAKEAASKPKPQTIRVGALSQQRIPLSNSALSSSLQDSLPPAQSGRPGLAKKGSTASIQTSVSNSSLKISTSSKPKALIAAERKKEQDEKEAQRKLDQKKEIERKRAAQQEEARQQERLQREETERQKERERSAAPEDPKKAASRQLIEKRRLELAKKEQQQRAPLKSQQDNAVPQERAQAAPATYRQELGGARPPPRLHNVQDPSRPALNHPPPNPARPALKRVIEPEPDEEPSKPMRMQGGPSYQGSENKRRRTGEDEPRETSVRSTMAPPIRQSNIRKELNKQSNYNNYSTAPPPASHHTSTLLKTSTMNQAYQQHVPHQQGPRPGQQPHDMAKYGNTRPPFADAPNPPAPAHKTPLPKHLAPPPKASPQFVNGENIHLEDIPTDSDSDDSPDPAKRTMLPDWVQSPELRRLLEEQEKNQNADSIFGPPQTPRMEEMFKDRHQRFRNRTSSANWTASGDRLTEEEKVADREARERVRREGGWTFGL